MSLFFKSPLVCAALLLTACMAEVSDLPSDQESAEVGESSSALYEWDVYDEEPPVEDSKCLRCDLPTEKPESVELPDGTTYELEGSLGELSETRQATVSVDGKGATSISLGDFEHLQSIGKNHGEDTSCFTWYERVQEFLGWSCFCHETMTLCIGPAIRE